MGKEEKQKACLRHHVIGEDALEIYNNFVFEKDGDNYKLDIIIHKFEAYCSPKKNVTYKRHKFFTCSQKSDENINQYVNNLRTKAKSCEFGELTDSLIKDRIVCGIPDNGLRARLLRVQDLKLNDAIAMCRAAETTKDRMKDLVDEQKEIHAVKHQKSTGKQKYSKQGGKTINTQTPQKETRGQCGRCGRKHGTKCPAMGKTCNNCQRKNHFAKMCFLSKVHEVNKPQTENTAEFFVDAVNSSDSSKEDWRLNIQTNGTEINFKLDTGSQVNIIPKTIEEHDQRLRRALEATRESNLKLNKAKCVCGVQSLTFIGDVVSAEGMNPDPLKVRAIQSFQTPESKKDVQRFLGMVNYQGRYIPDLSTKTAALRRLLDENNEFRWDVEEKKSFEELKDILTSEPILRFCDSEREIKISADGSKSGLGAVILQKYKDEWFPVAYASRALSQAETRYAQIEKEMLVITFACERFHQYIYGQEVQVEADHKPLIAIFRKSLNDCPMRIQRLMLRLQKYALEVTFTPGKYMYTSDALSRAYESTETPEDRSGEAEVVPYVDFIIHSIPVIDRKMKEIRHETSKDQELQLLIETIVNGFQIASQNVHRRY